MNKAIIIAAIVVIGIFAAALGIFSSSDENVNTEQNDIAPEPAPEPTESTGRNLVVEFQDGLAVSAKP